MKLSLTFIFLSVLLTFISCKNNNKTKIELKPKEIALANRVSFDQEILKDLRTYSDSAFTQLITDMEIYDSIENDYQYFKKENQGIVFNASEDDAYLIVESLRKDFKEKGYLIFTSEQNFGYDPDKVAVLKSRDQFEILRIKGVNGINYDIDNEMVITKLKEWNNKYPFDVIGCDMDWVEIQFKTLPKDLDNFANEIYEFCQDIVDQGTGSVEELVKEIKTTKQLFLWWD